MHVRRLPPRRNGGGLVTRRGNLGALPSASDETPVATVLAALRASLAAEPQTKPHAVDDTFAAVRQAEATALWLRGNRLVPAMTVAIAGAL